MAVIQIRELARVLLAFFLITSVTASDVLPRNSDPTLATQRFKLSSGWRFWRSETIPDDIIYDLRPGANGTNLTVLKPWVLPGANPFIQDPENHHVRPSEEPNIDLPYVKSNYDDSDWDEVRVPHDWAIAGPFYTGDKPTIGYDMGLLPVQGVGWYRRTIQVHKGDLEKSLYLDVDGAMSYPMIWLNGHLVGGWAYGYNSFRVDLTPFVHEGDDNILAIRVENPAGRSSRWYPGAGLYRNVWLVKSNKVHVAQWGTFISTKDISDSQATVDMTVEVENSDVEKSKNITVKTTIHPHGKDESVAELNFEKLELVAGAKKTVSGSVVLTNPQLWDIPPSGTPNLYVAVTQVFDGMELLDLHETLFGVRDIQFDPDHGVFVNGKKVFIQGVNMHHDLGSLGAAFNDRAARRQLDGLREVGVNAIRTAHNPPAPEFLQMTDEMGFLVLDEIFDSWEVRKTDVDFHLIFPQWREADLRAFLRRDRNHPSVMAWSYGNEVAEQQIADRRGAEISTYLRGIVDEEDSTRPSAISLHFSKPNTALAQTVDMVNLNYQGEGMRYGPAYAHFTTGNRTPPQYKNFHDAFPDKIIIGSEVAWSLSSRGTFLFPVTPFNSAPVNNTYGGDSANKEISSYELYSADSGSSPDRVFLTQDEHPFVAGGFVWAGWDYIGEPYPYKSRSAYSGIFDLAGFKKTRFYQYQARWRPDLPMAHIIPHWTWPEDRVGEITPIHVFSSADEAEVFLNDESLGRLKKGEGEYRFRWDNATYTPGEVRVVTWKDGKAWATDSVRTAGKATHLRAEPDCMSIKSDGEDLCFVTVTVHDEEGVFVPDADNEIGFAVCGSGEIVATDNGYQADLTAFPSKERKAFNGMALGIVRARPGAGGKLKVQARAEGLKGAQVTIDVQKG